MTSKLYSQLFLLVLTATMGALYVFTLGHSMPEAYLTVATLALIGLSLAMEHLFPLHRDWNRGKGDTVGDIEVHCVVSSCSTAPAFKRRI